MKKKIFIFAAIVIFLAFFAGLFYVFVTPKAASTTAQQETNTAPMQLISFRGVLADFQDDFKEGVAKIEEKIGEVLPSPFSEKENKSIDASTASSGDDSFTFAIIGDTQRFTAGNVNGNFQKVSASISKLKPDMAVAVGDLISGCEGKSSDATDYANWKKVLGTLAAKTYAVQGNHDRVSDGKSCDRLWQNTFSFPTNGPAGFSEMVYSFDIQNSHFVMLDSDNPDAHQVNEYQRAWLEQDLAKNKKEDVFVFFHEPAFPVSSKIDESLDMQASQRNSLWQILDKYNVTAVFNGHEHIVSRRKIDSSVFSGAKNSIYQFIFANTDSFDHELPESGVAEYSNQGQGRFGFVKVNGKEITVETHGPDGALLNTFTFSK